MPCSALVSQLALAVIYPWRFDHRVHHAQCRADSWLLLYSLSRVGSIRSKDPIPDNCRSAENSRNHKICCRCCISQCPRVLPLQASWHSAYLGQPVSGPSLLSTQVGAQGSDDRLKPHCTVLEKWTTKKEASPNTGLACRGGEQGGSRLTVQALPLADPDKSAGSRGLVAGFPRYACIRP